MSAIPTGKAIRRETLVAVLRAALETGELRFARQAALAWLAAFPGDLEITLLHAQSILADSSVGEGQLRRVIPAVEMVCRKDPFSADGYRLLARASQSTDPLRYAFAVTSLYALTGTGAPLAGWGEPLRRSLGTYDARMFADAGIHARDALRLNPDLPLAAVLHLLAARPSLDPLAAYELTEAYHNRWPECLPVSLVLAELYLERGSEPEAVQLLHLCAANDATGQVPRRLWGERHPYRSLWPDGLSIHFDLPIPASVAGRLGWNQLAPGELRHSMETAAEPLPVAGGQADSVTDGLTDALDECEPAQEAEPVVLSAAEGTAVEVEDPLGPILWPELAEAESQAEAALPELPEIAAEQPALAGGQPAEPSPCQEPSKSAGAGISSKRRRGRKTDLNATAQSVGSELEKLAKQIKQNPLTRMDGRFPVYVILSSHEGLCAQYGPQTTTVLQNEMRKLSAAVRQRPGWGSIVYFPDDAGCVSQYGLTPVNPRDAWKLKTALTDLDVALRQRGEMIGALLIVGGDEVVPFHRLPNPTDDLDGEVFSDSPYASLDANYFVPEWPVGRLPGDKSPDAALLLDQLRNMQRYHSRRKKVRPVLGLDWLGLLGSLVEHLLPARPATSFGYTAAVWRRSSLAVFRPIGAPHTVRTSPPEHSGSVDRERITFSSLGYYNLHGLEDSPDWYGQRDPLENSEETDYPVALSPDDLKRNGHAPRVVFSEACFGAHVFGKVEKESLALKFLGMGTQAVVGSTCTAYGSLNTPLIAADLLGNLFWQHLKAGRTSGEALMQAKLDLAREMNRRQGFLDGEDQKTLISFVLYGDPLCAYDGFRVKSKVRRMKTHTLLKTVPDQPEEAIPTSHVSGEVLKQVKSIVAEYLPGAEMAEMHFSRQNVPTDGRGKPGAKNGSQSTNGQGGGDRMIVTVSKQVRSAEHLHTHTLRVTLDEAGKPVKMSISR